MEKKIEELIYEETDARLKEMAGDNYVFPAKIGREDIIGIISMIGISIVLVVLCMMEVIR